MGTGECAPLTVGVAVVGDHVGAAVIGAAVVGAAAQAQPESRRREGSPTVPVSYRTGPSRRIGGGLLRGHRAPLQPHGAQTSPDEPRRVPPFTHSLTRAVLGGGAKDQG